MEAEYLVELRLLQNAALLINYETRQHLNSIRLNDSSLHFPLTKDLN